MTTKTIHSIEIKTANLSNDIDKDTTQLNEVASGLRTNKIDVYISVIAQGLIKSFISSYFYQ